ncbi:hypothetical protein BD289DRAFT_420200 [Coniella lustricola]|uniref:Uncharacterized protein n=1 Tax=Coniella lustricola TaxID=2025994 RepID=A0A2T3AMX6_9PEZI|nr:hypothetical protein BD289DRAFT_420200 [Coniella lustricola]
MVAFSWWSHSGGDSSKMPSPRSRHIVHAGHAARPTRHDGTRKCVIAPASWNMASPAVLPIQGEPGPLEAFGSCWWSNKCNKCNPNESTRCHSFQVRSQTNALAARLANRAAASFSATRADYVSRIRSTCPGCLILSPSTRRHLQVHPASLWYGLDSNRGPVTCCRKSLFRILLQHSQKPA